MHAPTLVEDAENVQYPSRSKEARGEEDLWTRSSESAAQALEMSYEDSDFRISYSDRSLIFASQSFRVSCTVGQGLVTLLVHLRVLAIWRLGVTAIVNT